MRIRRTSGIPGIEINRRVELLPQSRAATTSLGAGSLGAGSLGAGSLGAGSLGARSWGAAASSGAGSISLYYHLTSASGQQPEPGQRGRDPLSHPIAHRIAPAGQPPGEMGVEAFPPGPGPTPPAARPWPRLIGLDRPVTFAGVAGVRGSQRDRVGMGVPSNKNGAFSMTTGAPSGRRRTIR